MLHSVARLDAPSLVIDVEESLGILLGHLHVRADGYLYAFVTYRNDKVEVSVLVSLL